MGMKILIEIVFSQSRKIVETRGHEVTLVKIVETRGHEVTLVKIVELEDMR